MEYQTGFGDFISVLRAGGDDDAKEKGLLRGLAERWWDTTHTFHFDNVGELTMTPRDFSAIIGVRVAGKPLENDISFWSKKEKVEKLFGAPMLSLIVDKVPYQRVMNKYNDCPSDTVE